MANTGTKVGTVVVSRAVVVVGGVSGLDDDPADPDHERLAPLVFLSPERRLPWLVKWSPAAYHRSS